MTEFDIHRLRELRAENFQPAPSRGAAQLRAGQVRRLEDMDGLADGELVVVLRAPQDQATALVALVDVEPREATEWDVIFRIADESDDSAEWVAWPDAHATVWVDQLVSSTVLAELPPEVTEFLNLAVDRSAGAAQEAEAPVPDGCRFGILRSLPGDYLWEARARRVRNLQALSEEAWTSGPETIATLAPQLLDDWMTGRSSRASLFEVSRSVAASRWDVVGGDLFSEAATQVLAQWDPTAARAIDMPGVLQGLERLRSGPPLQLPKSTQAPLDEVAIGLKAAQMHGSSESITVVLLRTLDQEAKLQAFEDEHGVAHHVVTRLVGAYL